MTTPDRSVSAAEAPTVIELSPEDVRREQLERKDVRPGEHKADHLLKVEGLSTHFFTPDGVIQAVDDVSFELGYGETLGLVGESGCGKSVTALSIARLVPDPPGKIVAGEIIFDGIDVLKLSQDDVRKLRGSDRISVCNHFNDRLVCSMTDTCDYRNRKKCNFSCKTIIIKA